MKYYNEKVIEHLENLAGYMAEFNKWNLMATANEADGLPESAGICHGNAEGWRKKVLAVQSELKMLGFTIEPL